MQETVVDYYGVEGFRRRFAGWTTPIELLAVTIGGLLSTFLDPTNTGTSFWNYAGGTFLVASQI
jgi:drug/metabolite transporter superfamily protein YnfA